MTLKNKLYLLTAAGIIFFPEACIEAEAQNNQPVLEQIMEEPPASLEKDLDSDNLIIQNAKKYLGMEYRWGGRDTKRNPGIDCMGFVFFAYADTLGYNSWKRFSTHPSRLVESGDLGMPVKDLDGILRENLSYSKLKPGDVVYFLVRNHELMKDRDKPLAKINGQLYWPWHMGLYEGGPENIVIHAKPGHKVVEEPLNEIYFDALFVTRSQ